MTTSFADRLAQWGEQPAIITAGGQQLSYRDLDVRISSLVESMGPTRRLVLIEARNELPAVIAYLACLRGGHPVMLVPPDRDDIDELVRTYRPGFVLSKRAAAGSAEGDVDGSWSLRPIHDDSCPELHPDLAVLLSTSGSTGSAKFVRLSHANLEANAASIVTYLRITCQDRAVTSLPFHYSYGLSVLNSHFLSGATVLLTDASVVQPEFWDFFTGHGGTSLAGVPYTFELLDRVKFDAMRIPTLRCLTSAGGRLVPEQVVRFARMGRAAGWDLFVMYGQTEATARMSYVPPTLVERFPGCIGVPIPGGSFTLRHEAGHAITEPDVPGELIYTGPNVMMGYARSLDDLRLGHQLTELATGDLAAFDEHGLYRVVGRKSRFLKIFGLRISLDELEAQLVAQGHRVVLSGTDEAIAIATLDRGAAAGIRELVRTTTKLPDHVVGVVEYDDYPLLPSGKVDYPRISADCDAARAVAVQADTPTAAGPIDARDSIRRAYRNILRVREVAPTDTFIGLGGDSLSYVQVEMALEKALGHVPNDWHRTPVGELEKIDREERRSRDVDVSVVLRAVSIILIVGSHFGVFELPGGAAVLFAAVGFNFARFQVPVVAAMGTVRPVIATLLRVVVPTVVYTVVASIVLGESLAVPTLLLYSNFIDAFYNNGVSYWFIEVLVQLLLLMAILLSFRRPRELVGRYPYETGLGLLAVGVAARELGPSVWNNEDLLDRVPHMVLWIFAFGWVVNSRDTLMRRLINTALLAALTFGAFATTRQTAIFVIGAGLLIWVARIPLIPPLDRVVNSLAAASLYIYLTHFQVGTVLEKLGIYNDVLAVVASLVAGVILRICADYAMARSASVWSRRRSGSGTPPLGVPVDAV